MVAGVTCGAGMPYKLSEIAASYDVSYLPIISSGRAFRALWKRAYSKAAEWLAAVVYEDPWLAGGHNGLSNAEDPLMPQDPYPRVKALRDDDARGRHLGRRADRDGRRRLVSARLERLDRQSRARPDRLPVRHAAAADAGKPDSRGLEGRADAISRKATSCSTASRRPASIRRRCAIRSCAASRRARSGRSPFRRAGGRSHLPARRRREGQEFLGDPQRSAARARMVRPGLHRCAQDARQHAGLRHAPKRRA